MKRVAIFGSTGSIGRNTLDVISRLRGEFRVIALTANSDTAALAAQAARFGPAYLGVAEAEGAAKLGSLKASGCKEVFAGPHGLAALAARSDIDIVVMAISGSAALPPLLAAIKAGKHVALANKEALVMAGELVMQLARRSKSMIIPIDSEQSAVWQCLEKQDRGDLRCIYLTASGGPLWDKPAALIKKAGPLQVLRHPRWSMGRKITVDSATMMNKGLELLEAMSLFGAGHDKIKIVVHPEAVVHSMVEFNDGVVLAQLSATDMRIPIQYALSYPKRLGNSLPRVDFYKLNRMHFYKPDTAKFPCLGLSYRAAKRGGTMPAVMNAANEAAVAAFLERRINFGKIPECIEKVMDKHRNKPQPVLEDILSADLWARVKASEYIEKES